MAESPRSSLVCLRHHTNTDTVGDFHFAAGPLSGELYVIRRSAEHASTPLPDSIYDRHLRRTTTLTW